MATKEIPIKKEVVTETKVIKVCDVCGAEIPFNERIGLRAIFNTSTSDFHGYTTSTKEGETCSIACAIEAAKRTFDSPNGRLHFCCEFTILQP